jgi:epoxyqueuosine reductase QueG
MEQVIREEITRFVLESPDNRFPEVDQPYFEEPLLGFASADNPLFMEYKRIIGQFHLTPAEIMKNVYGERRGEAKTVICWILPITRETRESNRKEDKLPSRQWAFTRNYGEQFNNQLRMFVVEMLRFVSAQAVAPLLSGMWRPVREPRCGMASTWSERHAAYAAGLGTFSLSDGFISEKGIAHRCGSVITDIEILPTPRKSDSHMGNCLYFHDGSCGACIKRCPVGAISRQGHDKDRCQQYVYNELRFSAGEKYGVMETGCGLCQTRVPCESASPVSLPETAEI